MNCARVSGQEHNLMQIVRVSRSYDEEMVVRWCTRCGAVVVDTDVDNRTSPGDVVPMLFPSILYPKAG